jgi:hypothetical protein
MISRAAFLEAREVYPQPGGGTGACKLYRDNTFEKGLILSSLYFEQLLSMSQKNWEIQSRVQKEYGKVEVDYGGSWEKSKRLSYLML